MNNFEISLVTTPEGDVVIRAHDLILSMDINNGNVTVNGKQTMKLANDTERTFSLPITSVRLTELNQLKNTMQEGELKAKLTSKISIWEDAVIAFSEALTDLLKADYLLENPE